MTNTALTCRVCAALTLCVFLAITLKNTGHAHTTVPNLDLKIAGNVNNTFCRSDCDLFIFTVLHFCKSKPLSMIWYIYIYFYHCSVWKAVFPCSFSLKSKFNRTTQFPFHIERFFYVGMWGMMGVITKETSKTCLDSCWVDIDWFGND